MVYLIFFFRRCKIPLRTECGTQSLLKLPGGHYPLNVTPSLLPRLPGPAGRISSSSAGLFLFCHYHCSSLYFASSIFWASFEMASKFSLLSVTDFKKVSAEMLPPIVMRASHLSCSHLGQANIVCSGVSLGSAQYRHSATSHFPILHR